MPLLFVVAQCVFNEKEQVCLVDEMNSGVVSGFCESAAL